MKIHDDKYDIIIIGSGVGGLVSGCFLAKAGMKVLIVEQHDKPGGCVTAVRFNNCLFDMGAHLFGSGNAKGILGYCLSMLGIKFNFLRLNPTDRFVFPDDIIEVPIDLNEYALFLKNKFPKEAKNIDKFFKEILEIAKKFPNFVNCLHQKMTYQQFLDNTFQDNRLKGILSAQYLYIGVRPKDASLLFMAVLLASYLKDGVYYPKGGTQVFSDIINTKFNEYGGRTLFKKQVKKILLDPHYKKAKGVELNNKDRIFGNIVISNADAKNTFYNLIGKDNLPNSFKRVLQSYRKSKSLFLLYFAIKETALNIGRHRGWHFSSYDMNDRNNNALYLFIPTIIDSSLAPLGIQIVESLIEFPERHKDIMDWKQYKRRLQKMLFNKIEDIIGDATKKIHYIDSATPHTFERFTSNSEGSAYGWEMSPNQICEHRLQQQTPFENLYLVGHWTTPGCGVPSVAVSGWNLANKILKLSNKTQISIA